MKAGSCRSTDATKLLQKTAKRQSVQWHRPMQDFVYGKTSVHLSRNPQGQKFGGITAEIFSRLAVSQSPSKI